MEIGEMEGEGNVPIAAEFALDHGAALVVLPEADAICSSVSDE